MSAGRRAARGDAPGDAGSPGSPVLRVRWLPGTDVLRGACHCGAEHEGQDPVEMWDWLLAHPAHPAPGDAGR